MIDMRRTGRLLKERCEILGITVSEIQKRLHIGSFQSVYAWFRGKTLPSLDNFYALAKLLDTPMESLIVEKRAMDIRDYVLRGAAGELLLELHRRMRADRYVLYGRRLGFSYSIL